MADDNDRLQPVQPVRGPQNYRVQPAGAEERPPRPPAKKKRPSRQTGEEPCLVTADKVDCKI